MSAPPPEYRPPGAGHGVPVGPQTPQQFPQQFPEQAPQQFPQQAPQQWLEQPGQTALAAPGARPGYGRPAPTRSNSRVVILTMVVVLVIGGALSAWLLSSPSYDRSTAAGTAEAFAAAVNSGNIDGTKDMLCPQDRRAFGSSPMGSIGGLTLTLNGVETNERTATAHFAASASVAGMSTGTQNLDLPMSRDGADGLWEICGINRAGTGN